MVVDVASPSSAATPLSSKRAHDELEDTGETADDGGSSYGPVTPAKRVHVEESEEESDEPRIIRGPIARIAYGTSHWIEPNETAPAYRLTYDTDTAQLDLENDPWSDGPRWYGSLNLRSHVDNILILRELSLMVLHTKVASTPDRWVTPRGLPYESFRKGGIGLWGVVMVQMPQDTGTKGVVKTPFQHLVSALKRLGSRVVDVTVHSLPELHELRTLFTACARASVAHIAAARLRAATLHAMLATVLTLCAAGEAHYLRSSPGAASPFAAMQRPHEGALRDVRGELDAVHALQRVIEQQGRVVAHADASTDMDDLQLETDTRCGTGGGELEGLRAEVAQAPGELEQMQRALAATQAALEDLGARHVSVQETLAQSRAALIAETGALEAARKELQAVASEKQKLEAALAAREAELATASSDLAAVSRNLADTHVAQRAAENTLAERDAQLTSLQAQLHTVQRERDACALDRDVAIAERDRAIDEMDAAAVERACAAPESESDPAAGDPERPASSVWLDSKHILAHMTTELLTRFFADRDPVVHAAEAEHRATATALERMQHEAQRTERERAAEAARSRAELDAALAAVETLRVEKASLEHARAREAEAREMVEALRLREEERHAQVAQKLQDRLADAQVAMGDLRTENARIHNDYSDLYAANVRQQEAYEEPQIERTRTEKNASSLLAENQLLRVEIVRLGGTPSASTRNALSTDVDTTR